MNSFKNIHPLVLVAYYLSLLLFSVFTFNPIILIFGLAGNALYLFMVNGFVKTFRLFLGYIILILIVAVTNPLFSHNGATALFFINDNRVTLEAIVYGTVMGLMIAEILSIFKSFNAVFDSEKLTLVFGRAFPKSALIISMVLNFVPTLIRDYQAVNLSQKAMGESRRLRRYLSSFSSVITKSMERAIVTSDSMSARGYGVAKRTFFSRYKFTARDFCVLLLCLILLSVAIIGRTELVCYPVLVINGEMINYLGYAAYALLSLIPFIYESVEVLRWKYSVSRI